MKTYTQERNYTDTLAIQVELADILISYIRYIVIPTTMIYSHPNYHDITKHHDIRTF